MSPARSMGKLLRPDILQNLVRIIVHRLDYLFLLRPTLFFPVWIFTAAGMSAGHWLKESELFWYVAWNLKTFLLYIGVTLISGSTFILNQIRDKAGDRTNRKLFLLSEGHITIPSAKRLAWACLAAGLLLIAPTAIFEVILGALLFLVWGVLYNLEPFHWKGRPFLGLLTNMVGGLLLFYIGWIGSGAPLPGSWIIALPYVLGFGGVSAMTTIPDSKGDTEAMDRTLMTEYGLLATTLLAFALLMGATLLGYLNGDPVISTAAALTLPFYLVTLIYRRHKDVLRTTRYSTLSMAIFICVRYPLLIPVIVFNFYLSRIYYQVRFGLVYPTFHVEEDTQ